jgi:hypothetical protein
LLDAGQRCHSTVAKKGRMVFDPRRASIINMAAIATGTCVVLIGYLAYVLISGLAKHEDLDSARWIGGVT